MCVRVSVSYVSTCVLCRCALCECVCMCVRACVRVYVRTCVRALVMFLSALIVCCDFPPLFIVVKIKFHIQRYVNNSDVFFSVSNKKNL